MELRATSPETVTRAPSVSKCPQCGVPGCRARHCRCDVYNARCRRGQRGAFLAPTWPTHLHPCVVLLSILVQPNLWSNAIVGDTPVLPLHPLTARITTMIASTPERASLEYLDEIECRLFPAFDTPMQISDFSREPPEEYAAVRFSKSDRLVNLADEFGPAGWEVEAYECS